MNRIAGVLLAAGRATRFGGGKLDAMLAGAPLGHHAARTMAGAPLAWRFAVVASGAAPPGFLAVANPDPDAGQGGSLALGVAAAREAGAAAVLVMLADMPFVPAVHLSRLVAGHHGDDSLLASTDGAGRLPPALIGRRWFDRLEALTGDRGARDLLAAAVLVRAAPEELIDVDTWADLERARTLSTERRGRC